MSAATMPDHWVTRYYVAADVKEPHGALCVMWPLSRPFRTAKAARRALIAFRRRYPHAYMIEHQLQRPLPAHPRQFRPRPAPTDTVPPQPAEASKGGAA